MKTSTLVNPVLGVTKQENAQARAMPNKWIYCDCGWGWALRKEVKAGQHTHCECCGRNWEKLLAKRQLQASHTDSSSDASAGWGHNVNWKSHRQVWTGEPWSPPRRAWKPEAPPGLGGGPWMSSQEYRDAVASLWQDADPQAQQVLRACGIEPPSSETDTDPRKVLKRRPYLGKLVNFGEVVYARVKSSVKGRPRWVKIMWLGKLAVSDLHFGVSQGGFLISSRSVRRLPKQYDAALLWCTYDMPWTQASFLAGQSGQVRKQKSTEQGPELNADEAVPEVVVNEGPQAMPYPGYVVPDNTPLIELLPPPPLMRTPEPPTPSNPSAVTPAHMLPSLTPVPPETASPVPMFVEPSASAGGDEASPPGGATAGTGVSNEGPASSGVVRARPADAPADAAAPTRTKRLSLDVVQTDASGNQLVHQDEDVTLEGEAAEEFLDCGETTDGVDYESAAAPEIPSCLIRPFSESEPTCSPAELDEIDRVADEFEFDRLVQLGVMTEVADKLDGHRMLTTKSVRTWRPKVLAGQKV